MNIYQALEEKRPRSSFRMEDALIANAFQPNCLTQFSAICSTVRWVRLFRGRGGRPYREACVERLLDARYGDTYHTVMNGQLAEYVAAVHECHKFPEQPRPEARRGRR